jgi:putative sugar O-methyltransferase
MNSTKPTQSALWAFINKKYITEGQVQDLTGFKSREVNFKISLWNPRTNGIRYLKALVYNLCTSLTKDNWERIRKIKNRQVGDPFTITYDGEQVCLDYLQAVYELEFIAAHLSINGLNILEIGAGYGRTCHAIVSNHEVEAYYIIDLKNCLKLSRRYLKEVLDSVNFSKIRFTSIEDIDGLEALHFDLCINIDSFAEMDPETVKYYLAYIDKHCNYLYVKNPVGKYLDPSLSISQNKKEVDLALNTGILCEVIDIHDREAVKQQVPRFIRAYRPGNNWECIADSWAPPCSYYWQALYHKKVNSEER